MQRLVGATGEALRPGAAAGAKVLYDRVKMNVAGLGRVTGNLYNSIYRTLSEDNSDANRVTYHISWNHIKAPHGHLVEYGYMQRYAYAHDDKGRFYPQIRPGMEGKPKPGRRASAAVKNAYYVTLPSPIQVPGRAFIRSAADSFGEAYDVAVKTVWDLVLEGKKV